MANPFIGQIEMFANTFVPYNWLACDGRLLDPNIETALFALLGTTYGGDGVTTFALPDLRARAAIGTGGGPSLSTVQLAEVIGSDAVSMSTSQMPTHRHALTAQTGAGTSSVPGAGKVLAQFAETDGTPARGYSTAAANVTLSSASVASTGGGAPIDIRNPSLGVIFAISVAGIYPST